MAGFIFGLCKLNTCSEGVYEKRDMNVRVSVTQRCLKADFHDLDLVDTDLKDIRPKNGK